MFDSFLGRKFSNKCKHSVKCIKCRMETIRKKKQAMVRYLKKDVADLVSGGHEVNAFGRMDALIVEINQSSCYDMIEQYCCCILEHLPTMQKERVCPEETVEAIATLIFAAARFSDLPELVDLRREFADRYGTYMETYINEEFVEKMQKRSFPKDKKLQLMQDIAQEFSICWDVKAFEYKISNLWAPTFDQPKIHFPSSNENNKQPHMLDERREVIDGRNVINGTKPVLNKAEILDTAYQVSDLQKQLKSEEHINAEDIKEYQNIIRMRRYEHRSKDVVQKQHVQPEGWRGCYTCPSNANDHPHGSTEKIKKVVTDELENVEPHQFDERAPLNVKTKGNQNGEYIKDRIFERNTCKGSENVHEGLGSVGIERQSAASMDSRDAKTVDIAKFARDINGTSTNHDDYAHPATSEVVKEMDHNVQGSQHNRTVNPESNRPFNLKPPYVKPKVTKSKLETSYIKPTNSEMSNGGDGGYNLMNAPFSVKRSTNADSTVEGANLLSQIPVKQAGGVERKNGLHGYVNDQQSFISLLSKQTEDDATNDSIYCGRHMQRTFSNQPRHSGRRSTTTMYNEECVQEEEIIDNLLMRYSKRKGRARMREPSTKSILDSARVQQHPASLLPELSFPAEANVRSHLRAASLQHDRMSSYGECMRSRLPDHDDLAARLAALRKS